MRGHTTWMLAVLGGALGAGLVRAEGPARGTLEPIRLPAASQPAARLAWPASQPAFAPLEARRLVAWLADDARGGRALAAPGNLQAGLFLAQRFADLGLLPPPGQTDYFQSFEVAARRRSERLTGRNVVGVLPGVGALREQMVVIGAHYDHVGRGGANSGSLAPEQDAIHNGADDNASGTAALLLVAQHAAAWMRTRAAPTRTLVFVAFDGEERGLLGSGAFLRRLPAGWSPGQMVAMVNMDMIGRLRASRLSIMGADASPDFAPLLLAAAERQGLVLGLGKGGLGPSDHMSFNLAGVPALCLHTGLHGDYHRPSDDADEVHIEGLVTVARFAADVVQALATRAERPVFDKARAQSGGLSGARLRVRLRVLLDYTDTGPGIVLRRVLPGGPAEAAGLKDGDRLLSLNGADLADVEGYLKMADSFYPGQSVVVGYRRDGVAGETVLVLESGAAERGLPATGPASQPASGPASRPASAPAGGR